MNCWQGKRHIHALVADLGLRLRRSSKSSWRGSIFAPSAAEFTFRLNQNMTNRLKAETAELQTAIKMSFPFDQPPTTSSGDYARWLREHVFGPPKLGNPLIASMVPAPVPTSPSGMASLASEPVRRTVFIS